MTRRSAEEKYTDPELRDRVEEETKASDKGGDPGQCSARKSQLLTREYEKHGGGYVGRKDDAQKDLERWTGEEWQTRDGETNAHQGDGTKRYLPKETWESMSEEEQRVSNTERAKQVRNGAQSPPVEGFDGLNVAEAQKRLDGLSWDEMRKVRDYEKLNKGRNTLLREIENRPEEPA